MEWYYASADAHIGPFSRDQMVGLFQSGALAPGTLVWQAGTSAWLPAAQAFGHAPPPLPAAPPLVSAAHVPRRTVAPRRHAENSVETAVTGRWDALSDRQKAIVGMGAIAAFVAVVSTRNALNLFGWATAAAVVWGGFQLPQSPLNGRRAILWGAGLNGFLIAVPLAFLGFDTGPRPFLALLLSGATVALALREDPPEPGTWAARSWNQITILGLSLAALLATFSALRARDFRRIWHIVPVELGILLFIVLLAMVGSAVLLVRRPRGAAFGVMGCAATSIGLLVWYLSSSQTHSGEFTFGAAAALYILLFVAVGVLVLREGPTGESEEEWSAWDTPDADATPRPQAVAAAQHRPSFTPIATIVADPQAASSHQPVRVEPIKVTAPRASEALARHLEAADATASDAAALETPGVSVPSDDFSLYDKPRRASVGTWAARMAGAGVGLYALVSLGSVGTHAYTHHQDEKRAIQGFQGAMATVGADPQSVREAGLRAQIALDVVTDLEDEIGAEGEADTRRLAEAYAAYRSAEDEVGSSIERIRSNVASAEGQVAEFRSKASRLERRRFVIIRRFDDAPSSSTKYEAADVTSYRKVVLIDSDGSTDLGSYGDQITLYVSDQGEQRVGVRSSNGYGSRETTESYLHYRIEGSVADIDRSAQHIGELQAELNSQLVQAEAQREQALPRLQAEYVATARPIIERLRGAAARDL